MAAGMMEYARLLVEACGNRMIGTPGNRAAAEIIAAGFERAGLTVERQAYPCPSWEEISTRLSVNGRPLKAYANTFSPSCEASGRLLPLGTLAEAQRACGQGTMRGAVPVLYGELVQGPLSPKGFFFAGERDLALIAALEESQPEAVITVQPNLGMRSRIIEDPDFAIPSATVPLGVGLEMVRKPGAQARLKIAARAGQGETWNNIARRPGAEGFPRLVICAHYDTKPDTPGALDNACGVAVLLGLAERLPGADIEFVAFSNEEFYSSPESDSYFLGRGPAFASLTAAINIDGIGSSISATNLATFSASPAFDALVDEILRGSPGVYRTGPWPASNHYLFFSNGVPSIALSSGGLNGSLIHHTPNDSLAWVGEEKLDEAAGLVEGLVSALREKAPSWARQN